MPVIKQKIDGQIVTITAPAPANLVTSVAGKQGAVTLTASDVGATDMETVISRESGVYNVISPKDFGAVGDGATDDTAAMQAALDAAEGKTLDLGSATYIISTRLIIREGTTMRGNRATIKRATGSSIVMLGNYEVGDTTTTGYNGYGDITLDGIIFDGNGAPNASSMVLFVHSHDINIVNCDFIECTAYHHLEINSTKNAFVQNCKFLGFKVLSSVPVRKEAIQIDGAHVTLGVGGAGDLTPCRNVTIDSCYFGPDDRGNDAPNVAIGSHNDLGNYHRDIRVTNNVGVDLPAAGLWFVDAPGLVATGNSFSLKRRPIPVSSGEDTHTLRGISISNSIGAVISNNNINSVLAETANMIDIRNSSTRSVVTGNYLAYGNYGIYIVDTNNTNVSGNTTLGTQSAAVRILRGSANFISSNNFISPGMGTAPVIQITGSPESLARYNAIQGNNSTPPTGGATNPYGVISESDAGSGAIMGNWFRGATAVHSGPGTDQVSGNLT